MTESHEGKLILGGKAIDFDAPPFKKTIDNDPNPPKITPFFSDRVLELADEVMTWLINEFDDGEWRPQMREFTPAERAAFFASLADAFRDSTEN
jgi:hypothetical protein